MPCDTIRSTTVDVGKMNIDILAKGLQAAGYQIRSQDTENKRLTFRDANGYTYRYEDNQLSANTDTLDANAIKRAYSTQIVKQTANKFGWKLSSFGENKFTAQKRRF